MRKSIPVRSITMLKKSLVGVLHIYIIVYFYFYSLSLSRRLKSPKFKVVKNNFSDLPDWVSDLPLH